MTRYAFDPQGSPVSLYDAASDWKEIRFYDAYGQMRKVADLSFNYTEDPTYGTTGVGFGGQWGYYTDYAALAQPYAGGAAARAGQILLGLRYYDPALARFYTRDPMGYEGGINLYAYCGNNPIMGIDPSGLAQDYGDGTVRITLNAFIPENTVAGPGSVFKGDNRGFNSTGGTFRLEQNIAINLKTRKITFGARTGVTRGRANLSGMGGALGIILDYALKYKGRASTDGMTGYVVGDGGLGGTNPDVHTFVVLKGMVGDPAFHGMAPPVSYHFTLELSNKTGRVLSVSGFRTNYPDFEIYEYTGTGKHTHTKTIYQHDVHQKNRKLIDILNYERVP